MIRSLMPREGKFFDIFNQHADCIVEASKYLGKLINNLEKAEEYKFEIKKFEKQADNLTYQTIDLLRHTFITPFDRDQIHKLISSMDDILDLIEAVSVTIVLYDVTNLPVEAKTLSELCQTTCEKVMMAVKLLCSMKNVDEINKLCSHIDQIEGEADDIMRSAMSNLFRKEDNVKTLIKQKAIIELLESITDKCEDVANIVEGIVLENA